MKKNEKFVITINREVGSGGRTIGRKLAERLGVKYYDKALVKGLTEKYGLSLDEIAAATGRPKGSVKVALSTARKKMMEQWKKMK